MSRILKIEILESAENLYQSLQNTCPEVNVIERVWQELKKKVRNWQIFEDIEAVQASITVWTQELSPEKIQSLTQWQWLMEGLSASLIY